MGKRAPPSAANSGMSKGDILKYLFVHKKATPTPGTSTATTEHKAPSSELENDQYGNGNEDNTSSSVSSPSTPSTPSTPAGSGSTGSEEPESSHSEADQEQNMDTNSLNSEDEDGSQISLPRISINETIFDESEGNYDTRSRSQGFEADTSCTDKSRNALQNKTDSGISDHETSGDSLEEFPDSGPVIINVESLQSHTIPIKTSQINRKAKSPGTSAKNDSVNLNATKGRLAYKRSSLKEECKASASSKKRRTSDGNCSGNNADSAGGPKNGQLKGGVSLEVTSSLVEKKRYEVAIPLLIGNLDANVFPTYIVTAQLIHDCILSCRRTSNKANELFEKIVTKCDGNEERFEFILQAIRSVSAEMDEDDTNVNNCYWPVLKELFENLKIQAKADCKADSKHVLRFLKTFICLLERLYELRANSKIYVQAPMVVRIFEGISFDESETVRVKNLKSNVSDLAKTLNELQGYGPEQDTLARLISLLSRHYYGHVRRNKLIERLKEGLLGQFSTTLADARNYGLPVLGKIDQVIFAKDVCIKIMEDKCSELAQFPISEKVKFMTSLGKSKIVRKHHIDPGVSTRSDSCRMTKGTNNAGESIFHRLCGDPKKHEKLEFSLRAVLDEIEASATGSVNVPDNGNNIPLHDAANNGRLDQLQILFNRCGPGQTNERMKINPLFRNNNGDTALHLAVKKGNIKAVKLLVKILGARENVELNLDMANKSGNTPMNSSTNEQIIAYLHTLHSTPASWEEDFKFPDCKVRLSPESVAKLKADVFLQQVAWQFNSFPK